ncbi:hypothetical protein IQ03_01328 [Gemmobacter caeni]|uniref:Uncharacterized protein n=1 Tax=Gemmobacter caeni TaxID=589035 RepID=A0A2T6B8L3_9RHOB|nr:hypothetical protein [Gemmobacter caeni]PTX52420.1 hypothetical protein C8N34_102199 [Gemmobacter caeni]TWJ02909.1 hypothetical protein IQ03_01328 [Gemmobacter caeni]
MRLPVLAIVLVMSPVSLVAETPKTFEPTIVSPEKRALADICASPQKILRNDCVKGGVTGGSRQDLQRGIDGRETRQSHNSPVNGLENGPLSTRTDRVERYEQQFTQRGDGIKTPVKPIKPITPPKPEGGESVKPWKPVDPAKPIFPVKPGFSPGAK